MVELLVDLLLAPNLGILTLVNVLLRLRWPHPYLRNFLVLEYVRRPVEVGLDFVWLDIRVVGPIERLDVAPQILVKDGIDTGLRIDCE